MKIVTSAVPMALPLAIIDMVALENDMAFPATTPIATQAWQHLRTPLQAYNRHIVSGR